MIERLRAGILSTAASFRQPDASNEKRVGTCLFPINYAALMTIQKELAPLLVKLKGHPNLLKRWISMLPRNLPTHEFLPFSLMKLREICASLPKSQGLKELRNSGNDWQFVNARRANFRAYIPLTHERGFIKRIPTETSIVMLSSEPLAASGSEFDWAKTVESFYTILPFIDVIPTSYL